MESAIPKETDPENPYQKTSIINLEKFNQTK